MNYHAMELTELKAIAKNRRPKIKHYYIMPRTQLIEFLMMETLPEAMILQKKTLKELQAEAKAKGIPKVWSLRRHELMDILYPASNLGAKKHDKNDDDGKEHNNPK